MKTKNLLTLLILVLVVITACNKDKDDDDDATDQIGSFTLKGEEYEINSQTQGILQLIHDLSEGTTSGGISITGKKSSKMAVLQIAIDYKTSEGISGNYLNGDNFTDDHTFDPWLCNYLISTTGASGNEADGTLSITKKSNDKYTVEFDFIFSDSTTAKGNITQKYEVQESSF